MAALDLVVLRNWPGFVRQADLYIAVARDSRPHLPHIARWVKPDVVVSAAGCRIDEHLEQ
jgi:hypothetical protein